MHARLRAREYIHTQEIKVQLKLLKAFKYTFTVISLKSLYEIIWSKTSSMNYPDVTFPVSLPKVLVISRRRAQGKRAHSRALFDTRWTCWLFPLFQNSSVQKRRAGYTQCLGGNLGFCWPCRSCTWIPPPQTGVTLGAGCLGEDFCCSNITPWPEATWKGRVWLHFQVTILALKGVRASTYAG